MTGDKALWAMRRAQRWPEAVFIADGETALDLNSWHHSPNGMGHCFAEIQIAEQDVPETLDFRCCIGMTCHLTCTRGENRARRLHQTLVEAKASRVITSIHNNGGIELLLHGVGNG